MSRVRDKDDDDDENDGDDDDEVDEDDDNDDNEDDDNEFWEQQKFDGLIVPSSQLEVNLEMLAKEPSVKKVNSLLIISLVFLFPSF